MGSAGLLITYSVLPRLGKTIIFYLTCCFLSSQIIYPQDKWLNFTASNEVKDVVFMNGFAWAATNGGLMRVDPETLQMFLFNPSNSDLPSNNLSRLYVDQENVMWIGTYGQGVVRFDGKEWKTFDEHTSGLKYDRVLSFGEDNSGILWIGTEMGVNRYYDGGVRSDWDIQGIIQDIKLDKSGVLWIASTGGLVRIRDCKIISFESQTSKPVPFFNVRNLSLGKDKDVWMLTDGGTVVYRDGSFSHYYGPILKPYSLEVDSNGTMWYGLDDGILRFQQGKTDKFEADRNRPRGKVTRTQLDPEGRVWACTNRGLFVYDTSWSHIATSTSCITSLQSVKIFSDSHKNIWMKNGDNLFFYGKDTTIYFSKTETAPGVVSFSEDKNGILWFGQWNGLTMFNGKEWKKVDTIKTIMQKRDKEIFEKYKDTSWAEKNYKQYLFHEDWGLEPTFYVSPMCVDQEGNLWLKAEQYLIKYDHNEWTIFDQFNSGIPAKDITALTSDSNNHLWIGTSKHGLYEFDGEDFISCLSAGTFNDTSIVSLENFNDTLVISSKKQVVFIANGDLKASNWGVIPTYNCYALTMFRDSKGNYWLGSQNGLYEINPPEKRALYDSRNSGLSSNYVSSINQDYAGNLWILTSTGGVNIFNEDTIADEQRIKDFFSYREILNPDITH